MNDLRRTFEQIWQAYSGEAAWQTVVDLSRFHRMQASPGYRQAAQLIHQRLVRNGLEAEVLSFPADEGTRFWSWSSFQEWDCTEATLHLVAPAEEAQVLADYRACPISLIQRSASFDGEAEVVLLGAEDGEEETDTSADTPDRTDPHSLAHAGSLAATYAYWLAMAGVEEATWLGREMVARFKARMVQAAQAAVTEALAQTVANLDRRLVYLLDRHKAALHTLERLAPVECLVADLQAEAERATNHELAWARDALSPQAVSLGLETLPAPPARDFSEEERQAANLVPVRQVRGPISLRQHWHRLREEDREAWRKLLKERKPGGHHTLIALALYWADGARSVLDIADLVELEIGQRDVELLLTYFHLLKKMGFVAFQPTG